MLDLVELVKPRAWPLNRLALSRRAVELWEFCNFAAPFWNIEERTLEDVSGNQLHGSLESGLTASDWYGTPYGPALHFDDAASGQHIVVMDPPSDLLDGTSKLSVEVLFRASSVTGTHGLVSKYFPSAGQRSWRIYLNGDEIELQVSTDGSGNEVKATSATNLTTGVWYHAVIVFNAGTFTVYVDGKSQTVAGNFTATSIFAGTADLLIGGRSDGADLTGEIANARIWVGRALNAVDALRLYEDPWEMYRDGIDFPGLAVLHSGGAAAGSWSLAGEVAKGVKELLIGGLMNGTSYDIQVKTVDTSENVSTGSSVVAGTPAAGAKRPPPLRAPLMGPIPLVGKMRRSLR